MGRRDSKYMIRHEVKDYKPRGWDPDFYYCDSLEEFKEEIIPDAQCLYDDEEITEFFENIKAYNGGEEPDSIENYIRILNDNYCEFGPEWELID